MEGSGGPGENQHKSLNYIYSSCNSLYHYDNEMKSFMIYMKDLYFFHFRYMMFIRLVFIVSSVVMVIQGDIQSDVELQKDVIVVGSGIAGLAAARTLVNTGKFSVNILEAKRERYGGRIFTDRKSLKNARGTNIISYIEYIQCLYV